MTADLFVMMSLFRLDCFDIAMLATGGVAGIALHSLNDYVLFLGTLGFAFQEIGIIPIQEYRDYGHSYACICEYRKLQS